MFNFNLQFFISGRLCHIIWPMYRTRILILGVYHKSTLVLVFFSSFRFWIFVCSFCWSMFILSCFKLEEGEKSAIRPNLRTCPRASALQFLLTLRSQKGTFTCCCACMVVFVCCFCVYIWSSCFPCAKWSWAVTIVTSFSDSFWKILFQSFISVCGCGWS